jgi:dnd system-associated protein 4
MRMESLFSKERLVYWPAEFSDVMRQLTGTDEDGKPTGRPAMYTYNTGALTLAAAVGVLNQRTRDIGSERKEISTAIFANHKLEAYIFLIPMLGDKAPNVDQLRPENEEIALRAFERYAAGGLEILRAELMANPTQSTDHIVEQLITQKRNGAKRQADIPRLI